MRQQREPVHEARQEGLWREHRAASGCEFEGQREAVQAPADFGNGLRIVNREREIGLHLAHTLDRWDLRRGFEVGEGLSVWQRKRQDRDLPLVAYRQWRAAGAQQSWPWD